MWALEPPFFLLSFHSPTKDGALTCSPQGVGVGGGLCISRDWPGWGLLLMAVNALSAEAAGRCFGGLLLNGSSAREKRRMAG